MNEQQKQQDFTAGYKVVPDEPTAEMREAGHRAAWRRIPSLFDEDDAANVYRSMLAAAPAAPEQPTAVPVLTVECEPDYWSGGHYHEGTLPYIDPTAVWKLPIGTELYTAPPANNQSEQHLEMVRDAERLNWILPSVSGEDSQTANTRTFLLAHQLLTGKTGKTAIDAAIAAEKGGAA